MGQFLCRKTKTPDKLAVYQAFCYVPGAGLEPACPCRQWCLRPSRLPIPPSRHLSSVGCPTSVGSVLLNVGAKVGVTDYVCKKNLHA